MPFVVFHTLRAEINSAAGLESDAGEEREKERRGLSHGEGGIRWKWASEPHMCNN